MTEPTRAKIPLRALTVRRPWAAAIAHGPKRVENRTWRPPAELLPLLLAIHAGQGWDPEALDGIRVLWPDVPLEEAGHPTGIVAVAEVLEVVRAEDRPFDPWCSGPWAWVFRTVVPLERPRPAIGARGLWPVAPELEEDLRRVFELVRTGRPVR